MGERNVVKMSETLDEAQGASPHCLSGLVSETMGSAASRLSSMDQDPIFREATARVGIRDFALALEGQFPEMRTAIADHFALMSAEIGARVDKTTSKSATTRSAGGSNHAEYHRPKGQP